MVRRPNQRRVTDRSIGRGTAGRRMRPPHVRIRESGRLERRTRRHRVERRFGPDSLIGVKGATCRRSATSFRSRSRSRSARCPIMATIFILLSPNRSRSALPFLIGWLIGLFVVVCACALLAQVVPTARLPRQPDTVVGSIEIVVGLALIVLALLTLRHARRQTAHKVPKWLRPRGDLGPWESFGLAFILNLRPKALLLAIAAGLTIRADADSLTDALMAIVIYTVIAASTVAVPIIATLAAPARMEPRLVSMRGLADPQRRGARGRHRDRDRRRHRGHGHRATLRPTARTAGCRRRRTASDGRRRGRRWCGVRSR